jgi:hypothetical protein
MVGGRLSFHGLVHPDLSPVRVRERAAGQGSPAVHSGADSPPVQVLQGFAGLRSAWERRPRWQCVLLGDAWQHANQ